MDDSTTMVNLNELFRPRRNKLNGDELSSFLATFPTELYYTKPQCYSELWVFWSQNQPSQNNSSSDDPGMVPEISDPWVVHEKIKSSFSKFESTLDDFDGLIQFWAPVTIGGRLLLTTFDQPFALNDLDSYLCGYRLCSLNYWYNVDANKPEVEENSMIITGAPASAFLNHSPEVVLDLSFHQGGPLVLSALDHGLVAYIVLPICDPSRRCCIGVLECSMKQSDCACIIFDKLKKALEGVDLSTFSVRECLPYKTIRALEHARDEIGDALKIVCESHNLGLAQVWIPYEGENHVPSREDTRMRRVLALKLVGYCVAWTNGGLDCSYYCCRDASDMYPLKMGWGLAGKTLLNHEPHFCINISEMDNVELLGPPTAGNYSCFAIGLRSIYTSDFDYVFEFFWPKGRNYVFLLESLLLTLKWCLPSFKLASGAELGHELRVLDVLNSSGDEVFKICKGTRSSPIPKASGEERRPVVKECIAPFKVKPAGIPLAREAIEQQFGRTMNEAARNLNVSLSTLKRKSKEFGIYKWQGPKFVKRKVADSYNNQTDTNEKDNGAIQDPSFVNRETNSGENTLTIKAEYGDDVIKFSLPVSTATLAAVEEEIGKNFELNHGTYKLKYYDEDGDLILMISDQHVTDCIRSSRLLNRTTIRLRVLPFTRQISDLLS